MNFNENYIDLRINEVKEKSYSLIRLKGLKELLDKNINSNREVRTRIENEILEEVIAQVKQIRIFYNDIINSGCTEEEAIMRTQRKILRIKNIFEDEEIIKIIVDKIFI